MAEQGILIADQTGGKSVATHDVRINDSESNPRVAQLTSDIPRPVTYDAFATPLRASIGASDVLVLDPLPAGIAGGIIDVSDASGFVFFLKVTNPGSSVPSTYITVTPLILSDETTPRIVTLLTPVRVQPVVVNWAEPPAELTAEESLSYTLVDENVTLLSQIHCQSTYGAKNIGFHISLGVEMSKPTVDLFAHAVSSAVVQQAQSDAALDNAGKLTTNNGFVGVPSQG